MIDTLTTTIRHSLSLFSRDPTKRLSLFKNLGMPSSARHDVGFRRNYISSKSIVSSLYHMIAINVAMTDWRHVEVNEEGDVVRDLDSGLNEIFKVQANIDQSPIQFFYDVVYSMYDEGVVALVPIETDTNMETINREPYDIRCGKIMQWYPKHVEVRVLNDRTGDYVDVIFEKTKVAIIENPLAAAMGDINSKINRLTLKLSQMDHVDAINTGSKLDILVHLPYRTGNDMMKKRAAEHMNNIEETLEKSKFGIGYVDSDEKITQLNRPAMNILLEEIKMLETQLFNTFGLTENILNGTAGNDERVNFKNKTIDPCLKIIKQEMIRKFTSQAARKRNQTIVYYSNPFNVVSIETLATASDLLCRNAIMSPNEVRREIGLPKSADPEADKLYNRNIAEGNQRPGNPGNPQATIEGGRT